MRLKGKNQTREILIRPLKRLVSAMAGVSLSAGALILAAPAANALPDPGNPVIFIGDSVTAGFGYLGKAENAPNVKGPVNSSYANSWKLGDNSLSDCNPPENATPNDACSNNNLNGKPWTAPAWTPGPDAPTVAYSYQIASQQDPDHAAGIINAAVTGSTPENWDTGGPFSPELQKIKNTHVFMTLGANPILASFLKIRLSGYNATNGVCTDSTMWLGWTGYWAYPPSRAVQCAQQQWRINKQQEHLTNIYKTLLTNGNRVMVLQYHLACPWSFGIWQPNGNIANGPAAGNSCKSQVEKVSECSSCSVTGKTSQWEQNVAALREINNRIAAAVGEVQVWASNNGINPKRLQMATPDMQVWEAHQAWDPDPWVFKNDTWIHPSAAGHTQLAKTVIGATCNAWGQWCGSKPAWVFTPDIKAATTPQQLAGKVPTTGKNLVQRNLPNMSKQHNAVGWVSNTPKTCRIYEGELMPTKQDGTCKITATVVRAGSEKKFTQSYKIKIS